MSSPKGSPLPSRNPKEAEMRVRSETDVLRGENFVTDLFQHTYVAITRINNTFTKSLLS